MSYLLYPVAPRFRWQWPFVQQHFRFASGVFMVALFEKGRGQADKIVVGRLLGIADMGAYQFVSRLSTQLMREFTKPVRQVLFPTMARLAADQDPSRIKDAVYLILEVYILFGAVLAGVFSAHAGTILELLVGAKWVPYAYVLQAMGCICVLLAINSALYPILRGQGHSTLEAGMQGGGLLLFVGVAFLLPLAEGMRGVLLALACAEFLQATVAALFLLGRMKLSAPRLLRILVLGLLLGIAPFWGMEWLAHWLSGGQAGLLVEVMAAAAGVMAFGMLALLLARSGAMPGSARIFALVVQRGRKKAAKVKNQ
ncbi:MAG TPA: oligosaccharide flippase family protein, partial [Solimonas sp.]|nr:oligosaccharide flippase family protein [Solimonas sp.]